MEQYPIAIAKGDGIGPEIMEACRTILDAAKVPLTYREIEVGEKVYKRGVVTGIEESSWDTLFETRAFLKAPITTPQGGGYRSLNVTIRGKLGLFANIRPAVSYAPFIKTLHPKMDVVIVRENEEDLYIGKEHQLTPTSFQAQKVITVEGSSRIIRYAFEFAKAFGRKKVTCFSKDNILKLTDGKFHKIFEEIAKEYPDIETDHWIVDIGAAKLATEPELFDVVVMPNLYGDILSDVTAQMTGSVGLAGSANIGTKAAMFEAIHGSAPSRAGQDIANPSGLILASILMLSHLQLPQYAELIHNAWLKTIEDGVHTYDIFNDGVSKQNVGTSDFAKAVVERLGESPKVLKPVHYKKMPEMTSQGIASQPMSEQLTGVEVYVRWEHEFSKLRECVESQAHSPFALKQIANRGVTLWPGPKTLTELSDLFILRFEGKSTQEDVAALIQKLKLPIAQIVYIRDF